MTEREANNRLKNRHEEYFKQSPDRITRYAAVIKDKDSENYLIEIAYPYKPRTYDRGKSLNIKNFLEVMDSLNLSKEVINEWYKKEVEVSFTNEITYQNDTHENESTRMFDKLTGGISVYDENSTESFGTAGAFFKFEKDKNTYLLSNYHVLMGRSGKLGDHIVHPSTADSNSNSSENKIIGDIFWKQDILKKEFNYMDAAIAKINDNIPIDINKFTRCNCINFSNGIGEAKIGMKVKKCGRTTGLVKGEILSVNATVNVSNRNGRPEFYKEQILTTKISECGDSGSVLVTECNEVIGLLFAGDSKEVSFANNISTIFNKVHSENPKLKFKKFV